MTKYEFIVLHNSENKFCCTNVLYYSIAMHCSCTTEFIKHHFSVWFLVKPYIYHGKRHNCEVSL